LKTQEEKPPRAAISSGGGGGDAGTRGDGREARLELGVQGAIDFEDERYLSHLVHQGEFLP
jgi:hypothetical protein